MNLARAIKRWERQDLERSSDPAWLSAQVTTLIKPLAPVPDKATGLERLRHQCRGLEQQDDLRTARNRLAALFADERGWRLSPKEFGPRVLAEGKVHCGSDHYRVDLWPRAFTDHPFYFRHSGARAAAVTGHVYDEMTPIYREQAHAFAAENGLTVSFPDVPSWWVPGGTSIVLFERAGANP